MDIGNRLNRVAVAGASEPSPGVTKALLAGGAAVGPLFVGLSLAQVPFRPGFVLGRMAISMLTLGDLGWIQILNFVVTGLLALACAVGMRRTLRHRRGRTWGPMLIAVVGLGLIAAGIFHPDAGFGFPPGAPAGLPSTMSASAEIHQLAFFTLFGSMIVCCVVLSRFFAATGRRGWAIYCVATAVVAPVLIAVGINVKDWVGIFFVLASAVGLGWISVVSARLRADV